MYTKNIYIHTYIHRHTYIRIGYIIYQKRRDSDSMYTQNIYLHTYTDIHTSESGTSSTRKDVTVILCIHKTYTYIHTYIHRHTYLRIGYIIYQKRRDSDSISSSYVFGRFSILCVCMHACTCVCVYTYTSSYVFGRFSILYVCM